MPKNRSRKYVSPKELYITPDDILAWANTLSPMKMPTWLTPPDELEDYVLADEARGIMAEMERVGDKGVSLAEFRKARGLRP